MRQSDDREAVENALREQVLKAEREYKFTSGSEKVDARLRWLAALKALSAAVLH